MITRIILSTVLFFWFGQLSFAQCEKKSSTTFFDADSVCLGVFYKSNDKIDSTLYWDLHQNKINVSFRVPDYEYGIDSLNSFLLSQFRRRLDFVEVNGAALVYILLERSNIKEVRVSRRIGYDKKYDALIKETLMLTDGNWIVSETDSEKLILFAYLFKMK